MTTLATERNGDGMTQSNLPPLDLKYLYFPDATLPQLFAEAAMSFPEKTALTSEKGKICYSALLRYAHEVALRLQSSGARHGSLVGLTMQRSSQAVGAILGTLFAGCAYVPLDVEGSPETLLRQQIAESGISHVLVDGTATCKASAWEQCIAIQIPTSFDNLAESLNLPNIAISPEDPAYVMFTSGSTGVPKGVVVPHRAIARLVSGQHYLNFSPNETFLLHSPLSFDASTLELWGSLLHGGCLAIAPARAIGVAEYRELLELYEVTTLWMTSAIFHLVADYAPETFRSLRQLIVGGDVIHPQSVHRVQRLHPGLSIVNGYGPTENCTFTTCYRIPANVNLGTALPIGRPVDHTSAYVLNPNLQPVPDGEPGELVVGGSGVALGYLNLPRETAERFVHDPFASTPGARMYRTGDRVYKDASGIFHFLGRTDKEVKISGRRIDLTELEQLVQRLDGVRSCAAFVLESNSGQKELALAVEMSEAPASASQRIRNALAARLPVPLLPACIVVAEQLSVNQNGKLDRTAIRQMLLNRLTAPQSSSGSSSGQSTLGAVLNLCRSLLGNDSVSADDNFFDAGGTSLLLIRLHAALSEKYPGRITLLDLFQATTACKLSTLIDARERPGIPRAHDSSLHQHAMQ